MKMQLERLFIEGEQERIRQEDIEKQQAEQVAAGMYDDLYLVLSMSIDSPSSLPPLPSRSQSNG